MNNRTMVITKIEIQIITIKVRKNVTAGSQPQQSPSARLATTRQPSMKERAGCLPDRSSDGVVEGIFRSVTKQKGMMRINKEHIRAATKSRAGQKTVGTRRADKLWGWIARARARGSIELDEPVALTEGAQRVLTEREAAAWGDQGATARAHKAEMVGSVRTWLAENEQRREGKSDFILREQKLAQLKMARKAMAASRGGLIAIMAAIVLLMATGEVILEAIPRDQHSRARNTGWAREAADWMAVAGWLTEPEAEAAHQKAALAQAMMPQYEEIVVDVGEGWGSVGRSIREKYKATRVIGVDRAPMKQTGVKHGIITAAVEHDLAKGAPETATRALERKVGYAISAWTLMWLSLECSILSVANHINKPKGAARGPMATSPQNIRNATQERLREEKAQYLDCQQALENVLGIMEANPTLLFAFENPKTSKMWEQQSLKAALSRQPTWRVVPVDQCAYGRKSMKPTIILTNIQCWVPRGCTGNGKCKVGKCAGTIGNAPGDRAHAEQTVPNHKSKRPSQGAMIKGKREYKLEAVKNAVAPELPREILRAARRESAKQGL